MQTFKDMVEKQPLDIYNLEKNLEYHGSVSDIVELNNPIFNELSPTYDLSLPSKSDEYNITSEDMRYYRKILETILYGIYGKYVKSSSNECGRIKGIHYGDGEVGWSKFNKLNTNRAVFSYTLNFLNKFVFTEKIIPRKEEVITVMGDLLKQYGEMLFTNKIYMMGALMIIDSMNDMDRIVLDYIINLLTNEGCTNFVEGTKGDINDMLCGIDLTYYDKHGKFIKIQIKSYRKNIKLIGDFYIVDSYGGTKKYKTKHVDFIYFYKYNGGVVRNVVIFKNHESIDVNVRDNRGDRGSDFIIHKNLFRFTEDPNEVPKP